jgi:copper resistance protein C
MRPIVLAALAALLMAAWTPRTLAHGDAPHPKCKKGYALDAEHKCVKAAKK